MVTTGEEDHTHSAKEHIMTRQISIAALVSVFLLLGLIQLVPYRVSNPPVVQGPAWDNARTEALARQACFDCHSNEVKVPWYGQVAPFSWLVRSHVDEARDELNFSEMHRPQEEAHEAGEKAEEGEMPPPYYLFLHPEARLTDAERAELAKGLDATLGSEGEDDDHHEKRNSAKHSERGERHH